MKNAWYRFIDLQRTKPLPGVLGPIQNAHTIINWHPSMDMPTCERRKLVPRIEVGCVTRVMRKIQADAAREAADLNELSTAHGNALHATQTHAEIPARVIRSDYTGKTLWGVMLACVAILYLL